MFKRTVFLMSMLAAVYGCGGDGGGGSSTTYTDTTPPTITSTNPSSGTTGVVNSVVTVTFSETMDSSTVTTSTFTVSAAGNNVNGAISHSGNSYTFTPTTNLASSTTYTATITTGVKDSAGNALASSHSWSFTTGSITGVSFANTVQTIFNDNCIRCHVANGGITALGDASFLPLNSGVSYGNLVNKAATYPSGTSVTRVVPGDSTDSILYKRISGTSVGVQMPKDGPPYLIDTDQNSIKTWIDEGALNN